MAFRPRRVLRHLIVVKGDDRSRGGWPPRPDRHRDFSTFHRDSPRGQRSLKTTSKSERFARLVSGQPGGLRRWPERDRQRSALRPGHPSLGLLLPPALFQRRSGRPLSRSRAVELGGGGAEGKLGGWETVARRGVCGPFLAGNQSGPTVGAAGPGCDHRPGGGAAAVDKRRRPSRGQARRSFAAGDGDLESGTGFSSGRGTPGPSARRCPRDVIRSTVRITSREPLLSPAGPRSQVEGCPKIARTPGSERPLRDQAGPRRPPF